MKFWQTQVDKVTTAVINKWTFTLFIAIFYLGMEKEELLNVGVVAIQQCGFK